MHIYNKKFYLSAVTKVGGIFFQLGTIFFLTRILSLDDLGFYFFVLSFSLVSIRLFLFGLNNSIISFQNSGISIGDISLVRQHYHLVLLLSLVIFTILYLFTFESILDFTEFSDYIYLKYVILSYLLLNLIIHIISVELIH